MKIMVEVGAGELIDKITILEIKRDRLKDPGQLANVARELGILEAARDQAIAGSPELSACADRLREVNTQLWEIEDDIRDQERASDFGARFVELARSVYVTNDRRAALKREINELTGSNIVEEKSYADYE